MINLSNKKYKYIQVGIASAEEIISWANPVLREEVKNGNVLKYNPLRKDKMAVYDKDGNLLKEYDLKGEVKKHETINYRTLKPERDGLFCEVIFGPTKDYQCACGKSRKSLNGEHKVCEKCGVELTESKVRRERMGYIALAAPVVHNWYLRSVPSKIGILLGMKTTQVDDVVYLASYIVTEVSEDVETLYEGMIITEQEHAKYRRLYPFKYKVKTGAEAIRYLLQKLDVKQIVAEIREELKTATKQRREQLIKRLEIAEAFAQSNNKPEWMVMDVVPVIPPDLRPMVQLDGGRFATTDLNDLYRRILNRNKRLRDQFKVFAPEIITKNEKRMLQEAVDALIDNAGLNRRNKRPVMDKNRSLKSLSDLLRGKQGRFRQNLLGKRVDYSGRSVIVVGPDLKMYQCGIPREMALILFKPFIINYLRQKDALNGETIKEKAGIKRAKEMIEKGTPEAMEALEKIVVEHPVLLNRAPTLHRLSIQAFEPKLVEGKAIRLHPLVTTAFNADFDGDQMPVHVPLSEEAQTEARLLMLASKNILAPKDGKPIVTPSQDMIIGNYYLSIERSQPAYDFDNYDDLHKAYMANLVSFNSKIETETEFYRDIKCLDDAVRDGLCNKKQNFHIDAREGRLFKNPSEAELAYERGEIDFHTRFVIPAHTLNKPFVHIEESWKETDPEKYEAAVKRNEERKSKYIITTHGKIIFNSIFPENFSYVNEATQENLSVETDERFFVNKGENYKEAVAKLAINAPFKKKFLSMIISEVFKQAKLVETSKTLDKMKDLGFYYSTMCGLTVSAFDVMDIPGKPEILEVAESKVKKYNSMYRRGILNESERKKNVIQVWTDAKDSIEKQIKQVMADHASTNHIFMMADSGARGSSSNFTQLAGMRGLMAKPNGEPMEIPIKSCFREGMSMSEFFISTHGARKGSTDTALKTAESGYLTRRLVDVSHDITVTCDDCGTDKGMVMTDLINTRDDTTIVKLKDRIIGRFASKPIYSKAKNPETGKKDLIVDRNQIITEPIADDIIARGDLAVKKYVQKDGEVRNLKCVEVRTLLTCDARVGVCVKCYGSDLSTTETVEKGEVVGVVAAQSIGEPGTQLTMRTFHSGGVAGDDITQGLPRIQELFEAREPKGKGIISEIKGKVKEIIPEQNNRFTVIIESPLDPTGGNDKKYLTDSGKKPIVKVGDEVEAGDLIVDGLIHPKELLRVASVDKVEEYILKEVQKVYRAQGVDISDKHVEIIIKQMLQKVVVVDEGGTDLLPGTFVSKAEMIKIIEDTMAKGKRLPVIKPVILGITRASLKADSFLSAASFQETTRVLTEAAIRGKIDYLEGLKENIIIGGLIPAGTGLVRDVEVEAADENEAKYDIPKMIA